MSCLKTLHGGRGVRTLDLSLRCPTSLEVPLVPKFQTFTAYYNQRTNGSVNAHLISGPTVRTKQVSSILKLS